jgi:hypothetical protein
MQLAAQSSQFCGSCGGENPPEAIRCVHCSDVLDPTAPTPVAPTPPLDVKAVAVVAAVAALLIAVLHFAGVGFSMRLLLAEASDADLVTRMESLVDEDVIDEAEALGLAAELSFERRARAELASGTLPELEAIALRERLPPEDQATVIGVGGFFGLVPTFIAILVGGVVGTAVARGRRPRELLLGLGVASVVQLLLWALSVEFDLGALTSGRLLMTGPGPAFAGGPILLLAVSLIAATAASTGLGYAVGLGLDQAAGKADCPHCGHVFKRAKGQLHCPACTRPLEVATTAVAGPGGMTRASSGASELLCVQCAKTYAADVCPIHPDEPLLDPTVEAVRFQLLDMDAQAGTRRFTQWTDGLGLQGPAAATTGGVCIECAKAFDSASCPIHTNEPLLDPTVDAVRFQLMDLDAKAGTQRFAQWTAGMHTDAAAPVSGGVCMECAKAYDSPTCPIHTDEPLLDPTVEAVRLEMEEADDRRRAKVGTRLMFGGFGLAATITVAISNVLPLDGSLLVSLFAGSLVGLIAVARVLTPALSPPRFTQWTGTEAISNEALAQNAKRELLDPIRRSLAQMGRRLAGFGIAAAIGGAVGAGVFFGLTWPVGLGALCGALLGILGFGGYVTVVDTGKELKDAATTVASEWKDPYSS